MADIILAGVDDKVLITICCGAILFLILGFLTVSRVKNLLPQQNPTETMNENHQSYNNGDCPICLGSQRLAIETNCGHRFCGSCLRNYFNRSRGDFSMFANRMPCPMCRQDVNILLNHFMSEESSSRELEEERTVIGRFVNDYNIRFGHGPRTLSSYIRDCPVLLRHMLYEFFSFGGLVWMFRLRVILCCFGAVIYFFNPLDIIPEAVFGIFGFLDDVIVFLLCVIYVSIIYRRVIMRRASANSQPNPAF